MLELEKVNSYSLLDNIEMDLSKLKGEILTVTKEFIELEISRLISLKEKLVSKKELAIKLGEEESFNEIEKECEFLIARLYTMINSKGEFKNFDRKINNKDLVVYAMEFATNLSEDLKGA